MLAAIRPKPINPTHTLIDPQWIRELVQGRLVLFVFSNYDQLDGAAVF